MADEHGGPAVDPGEDLGDIGDESFGGQFGRVVGAVRVVGSAPVWKAASKVNTRPYRRSQGNLPAPGAPSSHQPVQQDDRAERSVVAAVIEQPDVRNVLFPARCFSGPWSRSPEYWTVVRLRPHHTARATLPRAPPGARARRTYPEPVRGSRVFGMAVVKINAIRFPRRRP